MTAGEREALRFGYRERVTDTHLEHIRKLPQELPEIFAAAAVRAREAGFLMVWSFTTHMLTRWPDFSARSTIETMGMEAPAKTACDYRWKFTALCDNEWDGIT